jgi:hypothetical protein
MWLSLWYQKQPLWSPHYDSRSMEGLGRAPIRQYPNQKFAFDPTHHKWFWWECDRRFASTIIAGRPESINRRECSDSTSCHRGCVRFGSRGDAGKEMLSRNFFWMWSQTAELFVWSNEKRLCCWNDWISQSPDRQEVIFVGLKLRSNCHCPSFHFTWRTHKMTFTIHRT